MNIRGYRSGTILGGSECLKNKYLMWLTIKSRFILDVNESPDDET
jgi:hypothetical protein